MCIHVLVVHTCTGMCMTRLTPFQLAHFHINFAPLRGSFLIKICRVYSCCCQVYPTISISFVKSLIMNINFIQMIGQDSFRWFLNCKLNMKISWGGLIIMFPKTKELIVMISFSYFFPNINEGVNMIAFFVLLLHVLKSKLSSTISQSKNKNFEGIFKTWTARVRNRPHYC